MPRQFPWVALIVIAATIFVSVTCEFLPTGLLPDIAAELEVSESQVGFLVTLFAGTVVLTAAPLAILTRRLSRKSLVIVVMALFLVANVGAGLAPTYELLAAARVLGGLAHGLFWAVMGAYAAHLVPKKQLGRAVAITSSGATAAFVLGVPLGTALGHAVGWRLAFISIAGIILVLIALVVRYLPAVDRHVEPPLRTGEIRLPRRRDPSLPLIVMMCAVVLTALTGHNLFYTYVAPWLTTVAGVAPDALAGVLFLYGGAGAIGLVAAGVVADRFPRTALVGALSLIAAVVSVLALVSRVDRAGRDRIRSLGCGVRRGPVDDPDPHAARCQPAPARPVFGAAHHILQHRDRRRRARRWAAARRGRHPHPAVVRRRADRSGPRDPRRRHRADRPSSAS